MAIEEFQSPENSKRRPKRPIFDENGEIQDTIISPRFRSVAAMAGWDEESLLFATLVVEDTPERESNKKRLNSQIKTSPMSSRRKRRVQRTTPASNPIAVLNLEDDVVNTDNSRIEEIVTEKTDELQPKAIEERKVEDEGKSTLPAENDKEKTKELEPSSSSSSSSSSLPCMDRLREELSCAICLEICYKPSSTTCGHSFCKKCLRSAADKCGKRCPKCRQLIGNGRSCTVNTVLWNTIQLLFPQEVEARKAAEAVSNREAASQAPKSNDYTSRMQHTRSSAVMSSEVNVRSSREYARRSTQITHYNGRTRSGQGSVLLTGEVSMRRSSRGTPIQAEDAALALRLQREEFMEAFRGDDDRDLSRTTTSSAQEERRARALRAISLRRGRAV